MILAAEDWKGWSTTISVDGDVTAKLNLISSWNKEGAVVDLSGGRLFVTKGKMAGLMSRESLILRANKAYASQEGSQFACDDENKASPLFEFAKVSVQEGMMKGEGQYALVTADGLEPLYVGRRLAGIKQRLLILDMNGKCIAKVQPTDYLGKEVQYEISAGVDRYAIIAFATCLFSGGGGANAGSGTGAF
jgi:hypothetical protein